MAMGLATLRRRSSRAALLRALRMAIDEDFNERCTGGAAGLEAEMDECEADVLRRAFRGARHV